MCAICKTDVATYATAPQIKYLQPNTDINHTKKTSARVWLHSQTKISYQHTSPHLPISFIYLLFIAVDRDVFGTVCSLLASISFGQSPEVLAGMAALTDITVVVRPRA